MKPQEFLRENEFIGDDAHQMHKSHQLHMLREECYHSAANAIKLHKLLGELPEGHDLDAWAAEKISLANDYLKTVTEWLEYDVMGGTNEAMMAGGMEAFSMESAERQYAELLGEEQGVAEGSVTPDVNVNKVHDDGHEKEWHIYRGKEMIGYVILNQDDTAEGLYIAYSHLPGRPFVEEFTGLKSAVNYIASLKEGVAEGLQNPAQEQINQILRSQAPNGNYEDDRYLDWIIGPESIQRLAQQTKLPLNQVRNYVTAFCQNPDPEGIEEGEITRTATGTKHRSTAAYGGTEKDTDHLRILDKATTNKIDKAIGVKFKKQGRGLDLGETTAAGSVSTVPAVGGGTLFGGNYSNSSSPFKKKSVKKESIIKR